MTAEFTPVGMEGEPQWFPTQFAPQKSSVEPHYEIHAVSNNAYMYQRDDVRIRTCCSRRLEDSPRGLEQH